METTRIITIELTQLNPKYTAEHVKTYLTEDLSKDFDDVHVTVKDFVLDDIYTDAVNTFGVRNQVSKAVEELMELGHALVRTLQHEPSNVLEEMADVEIMLEQLKRIFGDTEQMKDMKLFRLQSKIYDKKHPVCGDSFDKGDV
jgi:hypothetical protein